MKCQMRWQQRSNSDIASHSDADLVLLQWHVLSVVTSNKFWHQKASPRLRCSSISFTPSCYFSFPRQTLTEPSSYLHIVHEWVTLRKLVRKTGLGQRQCKERMPHKSRKSTLLAIILWNVWSNTDMSSVLAFVSWSVMLSQSLLRYPQAHS